MLPRFRPVVAVLALSLTLGAAMAAADSPQFRGPERSGIYPADGLLQSWPEGGPPQLWTATGLGDGYASVSIADGRIYTTGMRDDRGFVTALDLAGKQLWRTEYGEVHSGRGYPGTRTTPTFHDGRLFIMSTKGKAVALDAASGKILWEKQLPSRGITWGITESPLVVDDKAIFTPGGAGGTMVALDVATGANVWTMKELDEASAYCSPRLLDNGTHRQIITLTRAHLIGVDPEDGKLLWRYRYPARYDIHAVSPLFDGDDAIYVSDGYNQGGKMLALAADGKSVSPRWEDSNLDVHHGGAVLIDGRIYGAASKGDWHVLDADTGEVLATQRRLGKGAVVAADGRLYGYLEKGEVVLVNPDPEAFEVVGSFDVEEGGGQHWSHPVIDGSVLYVRHGDALMAYDIAATP